MKLTLCFLCDLHPAGSVQITIWIGVFPLVITRWLTLGLTIYSVATQMVLYYVRHPNHTEALWFASVANSLLWWTYIKVRIMGCLHSTACFTVLA